MVWAGNACLIGGLRQFFRFSYRYYSNIFMDPIIEENEPHEIRNKENEPNQFPIQKGKKSVLLFGFKLIYTLSNPKWRIQVSNEAQRKNSREALKHFNSIRMIYFPAKLAWDMYESKINSYVSSIPIWDFVGQSTLFFIFWTQEPVAHQSGKKKKEQEKSESSIQFLLNHIFSYLHLLITCEG